VVLSFINTLGSLIIRSNGTCGRGESLRNEKPHKKTKTKAKIFQQDSVVVSSKDG